MLLLNPIRLLLVIYKIGMRSHLAIKVGKLADGLREGSAATLLLQQLDIPRVKRKVLKGFVVEDVGFSCIKRRLN
jgi:hypothetical protein